MKDSDEIIQVIGAKVHNLKNVNVEIPRGKLTVITGLSGSGKSSLAFDTIYAEGQRRYMETFSVYARQFIGAMERPDVEKITGLSPVIAIEQKTTNKNPRSTVGTITEIGDFLRLLFARASVAYSPNTGEEMVHYSDNQIIDLILQDYSQKKIAILAPLVKGRKGHYRELFESLQKKGYTIARVDGEIIEIHGNIRLDRYKIHDVELVVDRLIAREENRQRLASSLKDAMKQGKGTIMLYDFQEDRARYFSRHLMCPTTGVSFNEPAPHSFSFNSPHGACPRCNGLGFEAVYDVERIIPDSEKSIAQGGILPLGKNQTPYLKAQLEALAARYDFSLTDPVKSISEEAMKAIVYGDSEPLRVENKISGLSNNYYMVRWEGVEEFIERQFEDVTVNKGAKWKEQFIRHEPCSLCGGSRLNQETQYFKVAGKSIAEVSDMSIDELSVWFSDIESKMSQKHQTIAHDILKEIRERLRFLVEVGLGYLSLSRASASLSGGEGQRIRLATQIGSKLVNVLYILDEPSIGLHQRDNRKLIDCLKTLRDADNSVIVVEHDEEMIRNADWIVDVGPGAGKRGGQIVGQGTIDQILKCDSITADYLKGVRKIEIPKVRRTPSDKWIVINGANGNNLKNVSVRIPLGVFVCVTGVSGSGKSTLVNGTLKNILAQNLYNSYERPFEYESVEGIENVDKLIVVDQSPIGRSPRSNPATYTNVFTDIRNLFEATPDAKIRGFKSNRFSFNVKGGRCEECKGVGVMTMEMNFLPDVYVTCKTCGGLRYNAETLAVKYRGKSINDVLNMTINQAVEFFENIPTIYTKLRAIQEVGLGYLTLGQPCTTLSGGESQRIKLAAELSKRDTGNTLYILDEPTTGLHFEDVKVLLDVLQKLVNKGNSLVVIEHNLDVIKVADWIIDMGPEGGVGGGHLLAEGTPEQVAISEVSYTGKYLKELLSL